MHLGTHLFFWISSVSIWWGWTSREIGGEKVGVVALPRFTLGSIAGRVSCLQKLLTGGTEPQAWIISLLKSQHPKQAQHLGLCVFSSPKGPQREKERHRWALNKWSHAKESGLVICLWYLNRAEKEVLGGNFRLSRTMSIQNNWNLLP